MIFFVLCGLHFAAISRTKLQKISRIMNSCGCYVNAQIKQASAKLAKMSEELFFRRRKI